MQNINVSNNQISRVSGIFLIPESEINKISYLNFDNNIADFYCISFEGKNIIIESSNFILNSQTYLIAINYGNSEINSCSFI